MTSSNGIFGKRFLSPSRYSMMNETRFFQILLVGFLLVHLSCKCAGIDECNDNGSFAQIRLVRAGKNAVFGPDDFIHRDSIHVFIGENTPATSSYLNFIDSTQSIRLYLHPANPQILTFPGSSDTLTSTTVITNMGECCDSYELFSVQWNGQTICSDDCGDVMEIEI